MPNDQSTPYLRPSQRPSRNPAVSPTIRTHLVHIRTIALRYVAVVTAVAALFLVVHYRLSRIGDLGTRNDYFAAHYPIIVLLRLAAYASLGIALPLSTSLGGRGTLESPSARSAFRTATAVTTVVVDVATIVAGALVAYGVSFVFVWFIFGWNITFEYHNDVVPLSAIALGAVVALYSAIQVASAWTSPRSTTAAWVIAGVLIAAVPFAHALDVNALWPYIFYLNPFELLLVIPQGRYEVLDFPSWAGEPLIPIALGLWVGSAALLALAIFGRRLAVRA